MKVIFAVALFAVVLAVVCAKSCKGPEDCEEKQCCTGFMPFRGTCKGMTKLGKKCLEDEAMFPFNEIHIVSCPCDEGLECVGKVSSKGKKKNEGVCKEPEAETTEEPAVTEVEEVTTEAPEDKSSSEEKVTSEEVTEEPEEPASNEEAQE